MIDPKDIRKILATRLGYEINPPTIDEFIEDPYYLGGVLNGGADLYPYWRQALRKIFPNPFVSPYIEVVATGAIGIGKTTFAQVGISYEIAKLLMLRDPHQTFNLMKGSKIEFAVINATKTLAKEVLLDKLLAWFYASPFFSEQMKKATKYTLFPKMVDITFGSRGNQLLGRNIIGAILDEMNFQDRVLNQAYDNYTTVLRRMQSRFSQGGKLPGHLWLLSSKTRHDSPLQLHVERSRGNPTTLILDAALWEVKAHVLKLSGQYFYVYAGDNTRDPFIIGESIPPFLSEDLDPTRIVRVPIEFYGDFEKDIWNALRDLAGVAVSGTNALIPSMEVIREAMKLDPPLHKAILSLDFNDREDSIIRYFHIERLLNSSRSPRTIHIDLALTRDRVGIASSGFYNWIDIERTDPFTGEKRRERIPLTFTDWVLYIEAKPGQEIPLWKVREFILDLSRLGYPIALVSTDGYQSSLLRQDLTMAGIPTELVSVDKTPDPYLNLRRGLYEKTHLLPKSELLKKELSQLVFDGKKVDHPPEGSKDGADAVAGSLWTLQNYLYEQGVNSTMLLSSISEEEFISKWEASALSADIW